MRPFAQATRRASHVGAPCACVMAVWVERFREDVMRLSRAVSTNLGAGLIGDTPVPSFFGELRRLNPRAPVVHLVRLESEGRVWVEHRARAAV